MNESENIDFKIDTRDPERFRNEMQMGLHQGDFIRMPCELMNSFSLGATVVYSILLDNAKPLIRSLKTYKIGDMLTVKMSKKKLAQKMNASEKSIFNWMKELRKAGYLMPAAESGDTNTYLLIALLPSKKRTKNKEE